MSLKFKGPIEEAVHYKCPGRSYCEVDRCFRNGKTCINPKVDDKCCLKSEQVNDLLADLGCPQNNTNVLKEPNMVLEDIKTCQIEMGLKDEEKDLLCKESDSTSCLSRLCKIGCKNEKVCATSDIDVKKDECKTIQQYCDMIDPSLLSNPGYKKLCCEIDLQSGVPLRSVCGCSDNPCIEKFSQNSKFKNFLLCILIFILIYVLYIY